MLYRAKAWASWAGFQFESNRMRRLPPIRFSPAPPALVDSRKTWREEPGALNSST